MSQLKLMRAKRAPRPSAGKSDLALQTRKSSQKYGYEWRAPTRQARPTRNPTDDLNAAWRAGRLEL